MPNYQSESKKSEQLSSVSNPKIRELLSLRDKSGERKEKQLFTIEGKREIETAIHNGYKVRSLFYEPSLTGKGIIFHIEAEQYFEVNRYLYEKIAYRGSTEGIVAIVHEKRTVLADLKLSENPFVIVLESIEKPGNLGAVLRTADAAGVDAVIVCDNFTDIYNPNVIRSSLGSIFTNNIVSCSSEEAHQFLKSHNISIIATELEASSLYYKTDFRNPSAIIMGNEANGLSKFWKAVADKRIIIPMKGAMDSLNVSVSTAIVAFEVLRQRDMN